MNTNFGKLDLNESNMDFDSTSFYPSAMYDKKSVYPKIKLVLLSNRI